MADSTIKTARRVFEILDFFDEHRRPLSLKELVDGLDYPLSSASALLKSMVALGYLDYDRYSRTYMPTMRMAALGSWVHGALFGDGEVLELVRHMSEVTSETITLGTQSDLFAQYIHVIPSQLPIQLVIKPGDVRSVVGSGLGWLLLSARSDEEIDLLVRRINLSERNMGKRVALPELMQKISEIRRNGYVVSRHTVVPGGGIIAMLLPARRHNRVLAIGINGLVERLDPRQDFIIRELRSAVRQYLGDGGKDEDAAVR
jgi:IclR family KDG regulon transcriptional repressor